MFGIIGSQSIYILLTVVLASKEGKRTVQDLISSDNDATT